MRTVDTENVPIIFPKYTLMLIDSGMDIRITGHKEADSKLAAVLYSAILEGHSDVPDIMMYNIKDKTWEAIDIENNEKVALRNRSSIFVEYFSEVPEKTERALQAVRNFVFQYSAAKLNA